MKAGASGLQGGRKDMDKIGKAIIQIKDLTRLIQTEIGAETWKLPHEDMHFVPELHTDIILYHAGQLSEWYHNVGKAHGICEDN